MTKAVIKLTKIADHFAAFVKPDQYSSASFVRVSCVLDMDYTPRIKHPKSFYDKNQKFSLRKTQNMRNL
jgi:hypothetical protein